MSTGEIACTMDYTAGSMLSTVVSAQLTCLFTWSERFILARADLQ